MANFDHRLWKTRAWERFGRALRRVPKKDKEKVARLQAAWAQDNVAVRGLEKLVEWCASRRVKVKFVKRYMGAYLDEERTIEISAHTSPRRQLILLLHECGHHLIGTVEHHDRFGMGYPQTNPSVTRTFRHRVSVLDEEMEAWARGWKLARRLDLGVQREEFDEVRLKCIRSYLGWAMRPSSTEK